MLGVGHVPADYHAYLAMLHDVFGQCFDKLEPGGRIAVNVANLGRKPYRSLSRDVIDLLERLGFLLRGEIVWQKSHAAGGSCAWGTYQRPGNPVLRDVSERIIVASKGRFDRAIAPDQRARRGLPSEGTITMDEFVDATIDVWDIPAESATRVGHPAPFPVELPRRLIELYTYRGDLVLDPFVGSGLDRRRRRPDRTSLRRIRHRRGVRRPGRTPDRRRTGGSGPLGVGRAWPARVTVSPGRPSPRGTATTPEEQAVMLGRKASELAHQALEASGFGDIERNVAYRDLGLTVDFRARDAGGRRVALRALRAPTRPPGPGFGVPMCCGGRWARPASSMRSAPGMAGATTWAPWSSCRPTSRRPGPTAPRPSGRCWVTTDRVRSTTCSSCSTPSAWSAWPATPRRPEAAADEVRTGRRSTPCPMTGPPSPSSAPRSGRCPSPMSPPPWPVAHVNSGWTTRSGNASASIAASGRFSTELSSAFANGRALLDAPDGLRGRTPLHHRMDGRPAAPRGRGGTDRPPHRPRLSDQLQVRVRHPGQRLSRQALRRAAGHLGDVGAHRLVRGGGSRRAGRRCTGPAWPRPGSPLFRPTPSQLQP